MTLETFQLAPISITLHIFLSLKLLMSSLPSLTSLYFMAHHNYHQLKYNMNLVLLILSSFVLLTQQSLSLKHLTFYASSMTSCIYMAGQYHINLQTELTLNL